ncbi:MAG TPA: hypothetical protein VGK70_07810 [Thermoanaerobaculia bacterium]|jgi:hypothetical protein
MLGYAEADEPLRQAAENLTAADAGAATFHQNAIEARVALYDAWEKKAEARAQEALLADGGTKSASK